MRARDLVDYLTDHVDPEAEVIVEAGGDDAVHSGPVKQVFSVQTGQVTISTEPE